VVSKQQTPARFSNDFNKYQWSLVQTHTHTLNGPLFWTTSLQTDNHASTPPFSFLQAARCPCRHPTNSIKAHTHTHTHPFNGPLSGTTLVSQYQKGKTNLYFTEARDSEWQWHQRGHMQVCTSLQTDNHASTPPLSFFTGRMPFLLPNQHRQSTEGNWYRQST